MAGGLKAELPGATQAGDPIGSRAQVPPVPFQTTRNRKHTETHRNPSALETQPVELYQLSRLELKHLKLRLTWEVLQAMALGPGSQ